MLQALDGTPDWQFVITSGAISMQQAGVRTWSVCAINATAVNMSAAAVAERVAAAARRPLTLRVPSLSPPLVAAHRGSLRAGVSAATSPTWQVVLGDPFSGIAQTCYWLTRVGNDLQYWTLGSESWPTKKTPRSCRRLGVLAVDCPADWSSSFTLPGFFASQSTSRSAHTKTSRASAH
jgi:hypothetical protein